MNIYLLSGKIVGRRHLSQNEIKRFVNPVLEFELKITLIYRL